MEIWGSFMEAPHPGISECGVGESLNLASVSIPVQAKKYRTSSFT